MHILYIHCTYIPSCATLLMSPVSSVANEKPLKFCILKSYSTFDVIIQLLQSACICVIWWWNWLYNRYESLFSFSANIASATSSMHYFRVWQRYNFHQFWPSAHRSSLGMICRNWSELFITTFHFTTFIIVIVSLQIRHIGRWLFIRRMKQKSDAIEALNKRFSTSTLRLLIIEEAIVS